MSIDPQVFQSAAAKVKATRGGTPLPGMQTYATTEPAQGQVPGMSGLEKVKELAARGVGTIFRGLRVPEQAVMGGVSGAIEAARTGDLGEFGRGVQWAVGGDKSYRDFLERYNIAGGKTGAIAGLALDLLLDPLWVVTPAKVARAFKIPELARAATSAVGQVAGKVEPLARFGKFLGRQLVTDFGKPAEYLASKETHFREINDAVQQAAELGKQIGKLSSEEQTAVRSFMVAGNRGARQAVLVAAKANGLNVEAIGQLGSDAIMRDANLWKTMVDLGLMPENLFKQWIGKHMSQEFMKDVNPSHYLLDLARTDPEAAAKLEAQIKSMAGFRGRSYPIRLQLQFLSERTDLSDEARKTLGEIMQAAHPVAAGQAWAGKAIATKRFLDDVVSKFGVAERQQGYKWVDFVKLYGANDLAPTIAKSTKLEKVLGVGGKGAWFPDGVADDLTAIATRPGQFERMWKTGVGWWKYLKVPLSPATQVRNFLGNLILADWAGLQPWKLGRYRQAALELANKGTWYQEAKKAGTFLVDTNWGTEIPKLLESAKDMHGFGKAIGAAKGIFNGAGQMYQASEQLFKMAVYIEKRMTGIEPTAAAKIAEEYLFNYRKVPKLVDNLRSWGAVPFVTFPWKATGLTAKMIAEKPATVGKYGKLFKSVEPQGADENKKVLKPYMQDMVELPWRSPQGKRLFMNVSYLVPFGDVAEAASSLASAQGGSRSALISSAAGQLISTLISGRDPNTNREISSMPGGWGTWIWNLVTPPWAGFGAAEMARAAGVEASTQFPFIHRVPARPVDPLSKAEPRSLPQTIAATGFGLRVTPVDVQMEKVKRIKELTFEITDAQNQMRQVATSRYLTEQERKQMLAEQAARIKEIARQIQIMGSAKISP